MTDGVARELEQAEARLAEAREEAWDASRRLLTAAIEVGRLRALAEVEPTCATCGHVEKHHAPRDEGYEATCLECSAEARGWHRMADCEGDCPFHGPAAHQFAALAAREEVQG